LESRKLAELQTWVRIPAWAPSFFKVLPTAKLLARIPRLLIAVLFLSSILSPFANPDVDSDPYFNEDLIDKRLLLALDNPEQSDYLGLAPGTRG
tara:strand:+ start:712 stop:993 length:282 start_codon:yes stop_codon:yes gene_type:complete